MRRICADCIGRINEKGRLTPTQKLLLKFISNEVNEVIDTNAKLNEYFGNNDAAENYEIIREEFNKTLPELKDTEGDLKKIQQDMEKQFMLLTETEDINEIVLNLKELYKKFTLEQIIKRIMSVVDEDPKNKSHLYTITFGLNSYSLNSATRYRLLEMIHNNIIKPIGDGRGSDMDIVLEIQNADEIVLKRWEKTNTYETPNGAFFPFFNKTDIDLKPFGIYQEHFNKVIDGSGNEILNSNYNNNCFINALIQYSSTNPSLKTEDIEALKIHITSLKVPQKLLNKIAGIIKHTIRVNNINHKTKISIYGKGFENIINIGIIEEHYFLIIPTEYTRYSIDNYKRIKHLKNFNQIHTEEVIDGEFKYKRRKDRGINSFALIQALLDNRDELLTKINSQDITLAYSQYYGNVLENFENLNYSNENVRPVKYKKPTSKGRKTMMSFDFETNPEYIHYPYVCCLYYEDDGVIKEKEFYGLDCGKQLLDYVPDNVMLVAHNAMYDWRFLIRDVDIVKNEISKGNRLMSAETYYAGKNITIKDSYSLITMRIQEFNKNLKMGGKNKKEVINHKMYNDVNIKRRYLSLDEILTWYNGNDKKVVEENFRNWKLIDDDNVCDILKYSGKYCLQDCKILYNGYRIFRRMCVSSVGLNIDNILTIPSLAHQYFKKEECYKDVYEIGGIPQQFIQETTVGGRCMTCENQRISCEKILNDFDAVSLYPSAMKRMGFLKGKPKVIKEENLNYNYLKKQDGYFVEIHILKVNNHLKFPLLSSIDDNGVRNWTNDMVGNTIKVCRFALEDLIEFQGVEFEVLKGYYYDEGRNYKIKEVIDYIFQERLKWKDAENPLEQIYKLIMNSAYGKTIMKPIENDAVFFNSKKSFQAYLSKNYNYISEYIEYSPEKYKCFIIRPFIQHFNLAHIGSEILAMSKRIMNEVMVLAEQNHLTMTYTDTDSIHILDNEVEILAEKFEEKYKRKLIGKEMGQFHTDFELRVRVDKGNDIDGEKCKNIVSIKSIFLGKKSYIDVLRGYDPVLVDDEGNPIVIYGLHIRMKGINLGCIQYYGLETGKEIIQIYQDLLTKEEGIEFDLMRGGCLNFKFDKAYNITTDPIFKRRVKFISDKDIWKI